MTQEETNADVPSNASNIYNADSSARSLGQLDSADLGAAKPVPQPKYKMRPVQHATVTACGHKLEAGHFPRQANCEHCWYALFETTPEGVASVHQLLITDGTRAVIAMHGEKFTKQFGKYLRKKLLQQASPEVQAASEIEGSKFETLSVTEEKNALQLTT
jgi:hypothetical protein